MEALDKIIDQLPYRDGGFRRCFITGLLFIVVLLGCNHITNPSSSDETLKLFAVLGFELRDLLKSPQSLFVASIIVLAVGTIANAMIEAFIIKGVSTMLGIVGRCFNLLDSRSLVIRFIWKLFVTFWTCLLWPFGIVLCTILNSVGYNKPHTIGLDKGVGNPLSTKGLEFYQEQLFGITQKGLNELYGDNSFAAWQMLMDYIPDEHRSWVSKANAQSKDLVSFVSSTMFSLVISVILTIPLLMSSGDWRCVLKIYFLCSFFGYLSFGCIQIVRRTTISVLELIAVRAKQPYQIKVN